MCELEGVEKNILKENKVERHILQLQTAQTSAMNTMGAVERHAEPPWRTGHTGTATGGLLCFQCVGVGVGGTQNARTCTCCEASYN